MLRVEAGPEQKWEALSDGNKCFQIALHLIELEFSAVDPFFLEENNDLRKRGNSLAKIGLFLIKQDRIRELRQNGSIKPVDEVEQKAQLMVNLNREELIEEFKNYAATMKPPNHLPRR